METIAGSESCRLFHISLSTQDSNLQSTLGLVKGQESASMVALGTNHLIMGPDNQGANNMNMGQNPAPEQSTPSSQGATLGHNKLMGVLSYIGPLVIISYLTSKDDPFVKFHIKQGLVVLVIDLIAWIVGMFFFPLWMLGNLINLIAIVLSIVGIVNVLNDKEKELPIVGKYGSHFKI